MKPPEHQWERRADAVLGVAASAILFAMMTLTFVDVIGRYIFNRPVRGGFEVTELMLVVLIFAGLPLVSHANEHVTMDIADHFMTRHVRRALDRVVHAAVAAIFAFMAWQMTIKAQRISSYDDATEVLVIPYGPFVYFMAAMLALSAAVHLYKVYDPGRDPGEKAAGT